MTQLLLDLEYVENKESLRVDLQMESDNEEDGSDSNENDGDDEGNSSGQKEADGDDFLIRERPAHAAPETAENEKDDNHAQEEDPEKSCQNPTIELKISLGDFGGPVMDLLGASDAPNPEASCEEEQDDNSQASAKETGVSNLLLNGKRKHESLTQKPKGPLITELS